MAFSPDGTRITAANGDQKVHFLDASTGQEVRQLGGRYLDDDPMVPILGTDLNDLLAEATRLSQRDPAWLTAEERGRFRLSEVVTGA